MRHWALLAVLTGLQLLAMPVVAADWPPFARQLLTGAETGEVPQLGGYELQEAGPSGGEYRLLWRPNATDVSSAVEIRLAKRPPDQPAYALTPSFRLSFRSQAGTAQGQTTPAHVEQLARAVTAAISRHDPGNLQWPQPKAPAQTLHQTQFRPELQVDRQLRWLTWAILAAALLALVGVLRGAARQIHQVWQQHARAGRFLVGLLGLGAVLRLAMPARLVMAHMGHELLASARELAPPLKYGPSAQQWLHALDALGLGSWPAVVLFHQLCAAMQLPILAGLLLRLRLTMGAVAASVAAVALAPVLLHDAATESILVPAMTLTLAAAWAWLQYLETKKTAVLAATFALAWAAMLARPELLALVPLTLAGLALLVRPWADPQESRTPLPPLALAAIFSAFLLWLRLAQMGATMQAEASVGNTPRVFGEWTAGRLATLLGEALWHKNGLLWPEIVPVALVPAWLLGFYAARGRDRQVLLGLAGLALLYLLPTPLDLPWLSVTRVQTPAMLWGLCAAGLGSWLWLEQRAQANGRFSLRWALLAAVVWLAGAAATVPALWRKDLATQEEIALQSALASLPPGPARVLTRSHADEPDERVHLGFADSLLGPGVRTGPLRELLQGRVTANSPDPVYVWLGSRCQLRPCDRRGEHPACTAIRRQFKLQPLWQGRLRHEAMELRPAFAPGRDDPNFASRDLDFPWCVANREFGVGLYRVEP